MQKENPPHEKVEKLRGLVRKLKEVEEWHSDIIRKYKGAKKGKK